MLSSAETMLWSYSNLSVVLNVLQWIYCLSFWLIAWIMMWCWLLVHLSVSPALCFRARILTKLPWNLLCPNRMIPNCFGKPLIDLSCHENVHLNTKIPNLLSGLPLNPSLLDTLYTLETDTEANHRMFFHICSYNDLNS